MTELLKERQDGGAGGGGGPPAPAPEVLLVNELIREYLEWNGYLYTGKHPTFFTSGDTSILLFHRLA